jgi:hypothetical protein
MSKITFSFFVNQLIGFFPGNIAIFSKNLISYLGKLYYAFTEK